MRVKTLQLSVLASALLTLTAIALPARAQDANAYRDRGEWRQDSREIRRDNREIRQDVREIQQDRRN